MYDRMRMKRSKHVGIIAAGMLAAVYGTPSRAGDDPYDGNWHFAVTPYVWLPNINGSLRFDMPPGQGSTAEAKIGPNDYLQNLNFAMMLSGEARKGPAAVFTDLVYLNLSGETSSLQSVAGPNGNVLIPRERNSGTNVDIEGAVWTLAGSYTVVRDQAVTLDVFGGMRYLGLKTTLAWDLATTFTGSGFTVQRSGQVSADKDLVDAIIGVRGRWRLGDGRWYVPYYLDIGTGGSSLTWQALIGVGYAYPWGDLQFSYRELVYDQGDNKLLQDVRFGGPAIGAVFHF